MVHSLKKTVKLFYKMMNILRNHYFF